MSITFRGLQQRLRERLLAHIAAGDFSGVELARLTGFQQAHISNFLNSKRGLSLEAMDAILHATHTSLTELAASPSPSKSRSRPAKAQFPDLLSISIVDEQNFTATRIPNQNARNVILIASRTVQKLRTAMCTPRPHWQRFIALRVKPADVLAMSPRLAPGTVAIVDRHYNSPEPHHPSAHDMYLVRSDRGFTIRYLDTTSAGIVLRPHNPSLPLLPLASEAGHDPLASILGRICFLHLLL